MNYEIFRANFHMLKLKSDILGHVVLKTFFANLSQNECHFWQKQLQIWH